MNQSNKRQPVVSARIVQVIEVQIICRDGTEEDKFQSITQYWLQEGELLTESVTSIPPEQISPNHLASSSDYKRPISKRWAKDISSRQQPHPEPGIHHQS